MSTETKLTRDEEGESVDNTKYRGMIGSLLYLTASRPDIMFSVCLCARFQEDPKTSHLEAVKRIFRYIKGTTHLGLWYPKGSGIETIVYADSDHAGDYVDRKSTSGVCTFMGCCLTSWFSKKQTALAISTTEAEYVSAGKACQQALWMKQALIDYGVRLDDIPIMCDNKGAIDLSKNPVQHSRTKHIEIRHHFLRDNVQKGNISIEKVSSEDNIADILTKPLKQCKIVGQILLDHPLSYALIATADVPAVFKLDTQEIVYTFDMSRDTLHLPMETPDNPFIAPVNIEIIKSFMNRVGYQGVVDKVSALYMKFLAQPWQTMFKVFNRCLTTRTSGHDQTKINILQLFHVVINHINVNYATLLWWDFSNYVFQKKDVIQYPRFTKLIIADLMKKFPSISPRLEEDYHSIKDDIPLVSVYTTGNVTVRGMLISDAFLTDGSVPLMTIKSMRWTPTLTTANPQGKKRKQSARETSSPRKSLKVTIKQKPKTISILPPSDDREGDEIAEATLLSITMHKTALAAEAQENAAKVQEKLAEEEIEKMVEGEEDEDSYASEFADSMLNDDVDDFYDEQKDDNAEKTNVAKEKNNDATGSRGKIREVLDHCNNVVPELTMLILLKGEKRAKRYFGNDKKADEMVRIVCEWKTNSTDDEASIIINP
ncbi:hypothetical protein Tco_0270569 [Tanacetum coccineum]